MIFVIVGSQKFPFNRLLMELDRLQEKGILQDRVFAQIGASEYLPKNYEWKRFLDKEDFDRCIAQCDLLITHAGEGSIMTGLLHSKKVVAVPRYARLGEHVSDHQLQIARALEKQNFIINVEDSSQLEEVLTHLEEYPLKPYVSGKETVIKTIVDFIG